MIGYNRDHIKYLFIVLNILYFCHISTRVHPSFQVKMWRFTLGHDCRFHTSQEICQTLPYPLHFHKRRQDLQTTALRFRLPSRCGPTLFWTRRYPTTQKNINQKKTHYLHATTFLLTPPLESAKIISSSSLYRSNWELHRLLIMTPHLAGLEQEDAHLNVCYEGALLPLIRLKKGSSGVKKNDVLKSFFVTWTFFRCASRCRPFDSEKCMYLGCGALACFCQNASVLFSVFLRDFYVCSLVRKLCLAFFCLHLLFDLILIALRNVKTWN